MLEAHTGCMPGRQYLDRHRHPNPYHSWCQRILLRPSRNSPALLLIFFPLYAVTRMSFVIWRVSSSRSTSSRQSLAMFLFPILASCSRRLGNFFACRFDKFIRATTQMSHNSLQQLQHSRRLCAPVRL
mmetsp:Transcript_13480/g.39903  ORF Transcript_13480/g.39903 Transcript_13480/m.39903 type:complete len:128 (-) Transcript_13480:315-698(-)